MGTWLSSIHVQSSDRALVRRVAEGVSKQHGCRFLLGPVKGGWIALLADMSTLFPGAGLEIAQQTGAPTVEVMVADDDDFRYEIFRDGQLVDRYSAAPGEDSDTSEADAASWRGEPERYADLLGSPEKVEACAKLLRTSHRHFTFESDRLARFARLLGLNYAQDGYEEMPAQFPGAKQFVHVPDDTSAKAAERQRKADLRAEFKRLEREGVLRAEIKSPGKAAERERMQSHWFFDPRDNSFLVQWNHWHLPSQPVVRFAAPDFAGAEPTDAMAHWQHIYRMGLSPSGRWLALGHASGDWSATLSSWPPGTSAARIAHRRDVGTVQFDRAEQILLTAGSEDLVLTSVPEGRELGRTQLIGAPPAAALHPDGTHVVLGSQGGELFIRPTANLSQENRLTTHRGAVAESGDPMAAVRMCFEERAPGMTTEQWNYSMMRRVNPERFVRLLFSPDGAWLFAATSLGMRAFAWRELCAAENGPAPAPVYAVDARPGGLGHHTCCYTLAFDEKAKRLLFAGLEGVIEVLDLDSGEVATLLRPPELLCIQQIGLSPDHSTLAVQSRETKVNGRRPTELRLWSYPALCHQAGL